MGEAYHPLSFCATGNEGALSDIHLLDYEELESEIWGTPPKRKKAWEFDLGHFFMGLTLVIIIFVESCVSMINHGTEGACERLCEPYVMESCGDNARTATCRTPEGYVVRSK